MLDSVFHTDIVLLMWIADKNFKTPATVNDAIVNRTKRVINDYPTINENVEDAIIQWLKERHTWDIARSWIIYTPGIVTSLFLAVQAFTEPNDSILIQTLVYRPFFNSNIAHERKAVYKHLKVFNEKKTFSYNEKIFIHSSYKSFFS